MKNNFILVVTILISLTYLPSGVLADAGSLSAAMRAYQHDMDIVRLRDLKVMGAYIEKYKEKTGKYPFEGMYKEALNVVLATKEQQEVFDGARKPSYPHKNIFYNEFVVELKKELGESVLFPFDPQRAPSGRQNFYLYMMHDGEYFLAVHLYAPYPFAQKIAKDWYKVEISNVPSSQLLIWDYEDLMSNKEFNEAIEEPLNKPDYVGQFRAMVREKVGFN